MRILKALKKLHKVVTGTIINIVNFILLLPVYFIGVGITSIIAK